MYTYDSGEDEIENLNAAIYHLTERNARLKNDVDRLESRLRQIGDKLEKMVITEGESAGVVLLAVCGLAEEAPYVSPLGEALMELHRIALH